MSGLSANWNWGEGEGREFSKFDSHPGGWDHDTFDDELEGILCVRGFYWLQFACITINPLLLRLRIHYGLTIFLRKNGKGGFLNKYNLQVGVV